VAARVSCQFGIICRNFVPVGNGKEGLGMKHSGKTAIRNPKSVGEDMISERKGGYVTCSLKGMKAKNSLRQPPFNRKVT